MSSKFYECPAVGQAHTGCGGPPPRGGRGARVAESGAFSAFPSSSGVLSHSSGSNPKIVRQPVVYDKSKWPDNRQCKGNGQKITHYYKP